jgi:hypothetical protein
MRYTVGTVLALAATLVGCARAPFYSVRSHTFEAVDQQPSRAKLVGVWRSQRETLVLLPDGRFTAGRSSGCWDVMRDGRGGRDDRVLFVMRCVNYGNEHIVLAVAEASAQCRFALADELTLRECQFAGEYRRE